MLAIAVRGFSLSTTTVRKKWLLPMNNETMNDEGIKVM
jgi:hypothetical protein